MKAILTLMIVLAWGCQEQMADAGPMAGGGAQGPYAQAQYICDVLVACFAIDVGASCAQDIASTTAPVHVSTCAGCYQQATCDAIGAPGMAGVCDGACSDALFGGAQ